MSRGASSNSIGCWRIIFCLKTYSVGEAEKFSPLSRTTRMERRGFEVGRQELSLKEFSQSVVQSMFGLKIRNPKK